MNNLKYHFITIAALSTFSAANITMAASSCPTDLSQSTAHCLVKAADSNFQSQYQSEYAKQKLPKGSLGSMAQPNNTENDDSSTSLPPKPTTQNQNHTTSNNNNKTASIHWF